MHWLRLVVLPLVLVLSVLSTLANPGFSQAQDASPVAGAGAGEEPDLAAMPITPADLAELGTPGMGRFFNGYFNSLDSAIQGMSGFYGHTEEETGAMVERIGLSRAYGSAMGLPRAPGDAESPAARGAYANIFELQNVAEADAFFAYVSSAPGRDGASLTAVEAPFALGERALVGNYSALDSEAGERYYEYFLILLIDNYVVDTGYFGSFPEAMGAPAATPGIDAALFSRAATLDELEALGQRQLANIEAVLANGSPNLPALLLRLGDDPLAATADYTEGYRLLDGELFPYFADRDDDLIADPATLTGAVAAYELEEKFQPGEEEGPNDSYFLNRLFAFPDEATARAFMASRPDVLAAGGFAKVSDAAPDARMDLLPGEVTDLGDESLAFSFVRAFDDGGRFTGYEIYTRVGEVVAAVSMEGPADMPLGLVAEIATAQAACLAAGACPDALPVPDALLALPEATPVATPAA